MRRMMQVVGLGMVVLAGCLDGGATESGMGDIDGIREEVKAAPTDAGNAAERRSALLRWWRLMWRRGQDMSAFDEVAEGLLRNGPESSDNWAAVDRGYAVLEQMLREPVMTGEQAGEKRAGTGMATDWVYYMGTAGHNSGYSPDAGPSEGRLAWRFPKGYMWNAVPVVEDGRIYLSSPGIDVVAFSVDETSGKVVWRGRQFGEDFYGTPTTKYDPVVTRDRVLVRTGTGPRGMLAFDKTTGARLETAGGLGAADGVVFTYERQGSWVVLADAGSGKDVWSFACAGYLSGEPQLDAGSVYAATQDGQVYKIGKESGTPQWKIELGDRIRGKLSIGEHYLYAGGRDGTVYAVDKRNGSTAWAFDSGDRESRAHQFFSAVFEADGRLYFGSAAGWAYCVDARSGRLVWKHAVGDWIRARPVKVGAVVYVVTLGSRLHALEEGADGVTERWSQALGRHGITADLVAGQSSLLASGRDFMLYSVDYASGEIRWRHGILDGAWIDGEFIQADYTAALLGSPTVADGVVYIGGPDGFVNAVDARTGREIWKFEVHSVVSAAVSLIDGKAMFGQVGRPAGKYASEDAPAYFAVDQRTGEPVWTSRAFGNVWIGAIERDGVMFIGDMNGFVYGVDPDTGTKLWQYYTAADTPQADKPLDDHYHSWPPGVYCLPVADDACFYTGSWSGYYFGFEHATGKLRWRTRTGYPETGGGLPDSAAPTLHKGHLYVQKRGHSIAALDRQSGKIDWEWPAPDGFLQNGTLAALGDTVFGSVVRRVVHIPYLSWLYCFSDVANGGKELWRHRDGGGLTAPVVTDQHLVFGSSTGMFLTALDPQTGQLQWRVFTGGEMTENVPAIYGDMVFSVSKNGWLNAVK